MIIPLIADGHIALPVPPNRLVGRERELAALIRLLGDDHTRLITLTGPGGVGKTHLALDLAAEVAPRFQDGVVFVALASIVDPALVLPTIAKALGLRESPDQALIEVLANALMDRDALVVLDNLEQVMEAGPDIGVLVGATKRPTFLATSRSPLHLRVEREYPVPPLSLPSPEGATTADALADNAAVALFVERSQAVRPSFTLTDVNAPVVAEVSRRLDGLPLAIELAAAMTRVLSPQSLLDRMEHRLGLLAFGPTDLPDRHRTLRDTIAWSHDLLSVDEQRVFRRMAVLPGGASLDAIGAVSEITGQASLLSLVTSLVSKSLVVRMDEADSPTSGTDEPRFRMLSTIQEYAVEQLEGSGEADTVRERHLHWLLQFAEAAEPQLVGPDQVHWFARLDAEHDNIRAALTWAQDHSHEQGMRLASMLWRYWATRGLLTEGHTWLCKFLDSPAPAGERIRAKAFSSLGNLSLDLGDYVAASEAYQQSLEAFESLGDTKGIAAALNGQGLVDWYRGDYASARRHHERSLELRRQIDDRHGQANSLTNLGNAVKDAEYPHAARDLHQQALAIRQSLGDRVGVGYSYLNLGDIARRLGDTGEALAMFGKCLDAFQEVGDTLGVGYALQGLGLVEMLAGNAREAATRFGEALNIRLGLGDRRGIVESIEGIASAAASLGQLPVAAELFGSAEALRQQIGAPLPEPDRLVYGPVIESIRQTLPEMIFSSKWQRGAEMVLTDATSLAMTALNDIASTPVHQAGVLSEREMEVLQLVAGGLTNAQVADQLFLSRRTVDAHLRRIYDKLDLSTRAEAIRFAVDHGFA